MAERGEASSIPIEVMEMVDEFVWTLEDTAAFVGGRVAAAVRRYVEVMLPPLAAALMRFSQEYEYSWHTPGHTGGTAFLKSPVGRIFFDYFGENMLRSDLSISVGSLGSLLDHSGPIGEHEKYAARVFGAHRTYSVTNGTSMSNRVIFMAAVARDQIALCDRNCHKSIEHSLVMTGAIPHYLVPLRNRYGIIGPIPPARLEQGCDRSRACESNPLVTKGIAPRAVHSIITNSTYDGLCYHAAPRRGAARPERRSHSLRRSLVRVRALQPAVPRPARDARRSEGSQGSDDLRHALDPQAARGAVAGLLPAHPRRAQRDPARALQRVVHAARVDLAALPDHRFQRHHRGDDGRSRRTDAHQRIHRGGRVVPTDDRPRAPAVRREGRVVLPRLECRHGAQRGVRQEDRRSRKPPRSSSRPIRTAGSCIPARRGTASATSKTATACSTRSRSRSSRRASPTRAASTRAASRRRLVTAYLHYRGVEVEKTTDFTILFLFSIGVTKGKWGTLLNALLDFKRDYDSNAPLSQVLPHLTANHPAVYGGLGLRDLAEQMFAQLRESRQTHWLAEAFSTLPQPVHDAERRVPAPGARRDRARAARSARRSRARDQRRALPARHPDAHARRVDRRERRAVSRLPARAVGLGQALPGLRSRHARRGESRRRLLRAVSAQGRRPGQEARRK